MIDEGTFTTAILEDSPFRLAPGQSRPLAFRLSAQGLLPVSLTLDITYEMSGCLFSTSISHDFIVREVDSPHKFTFLHPSGVVSYAILRAPSTKVCLELDPRRDLPVLFNLHGAGLEADSHQVRHILDSVPDLPSWVLFPTGVTPWSADDWRKAPQFGWR